MWDLGRRFGTAAALEHALYRLVNVVMFFEWLDVIVLERERLEAPDPTTSARLSTRVATRADLDAMAAEPLLGIGPSKVDNFLAGDICLLSYVDGALAGYTWAHTRGCPELIPGFVISVPAQYVYNYAGYTLPAFRGLGLQAYRHRVLLEDRVRADSHGLLGYVAHTNFASRRGQTKSGYRTVGSVWLVGTPRHFVALFSGGLRRMGICRL